MGVSALLALAVASPIRPDELSLAQHRIRQLGREAYPRTRNPRRMRDGMARAIVDR